MTFLFILKKLLIRELDLFANIIGEAHGERDDLRDGIVLRNKALNMVINSISFRGAGHRNKFLWLIVKLLHTAKELFGETR
jgi:hypothetical protein